MGTASKENDKKPWPTLATMQQVYQNKFWGDNGSEFYSGQGSHLSKYVYPYVEVVQDFLESFEEPITVCDLGCGDFNIGKKLAPFAQQYIAVDIVPELITFNTKFFSLPNVEFRCLDIAKDQLPSGDCAILRQVLQHLSNTEVKSIVAKLYGYKYVVLTEHLPEDSFVPNMDIISGQGTRLKKGSGIDLFAPPFHFKVKRSKQVLSIADTTYGGRLVTYLFTVF